MALTKCPEYRQKGKQKTIIKGFFHQKKRFLSILLVFSLCAGIIGFASPTASAASTTAQNSAQTLYELGLFKGTGVNPDGTPIFDLDKTPTRNQAIIMLVRLLGKENEALAGTWDIPFTDVSESMRPYIGYAYANGLTNGTSATTYSGTTPIRPNQYLAFLLRALGYISGVDFEVSTAWELSNKICDIYQDTYSDFSDVLKFTADSITTPTIPASNNAPRSSIVKVYDYVRECLKTEGSITNYFELAWQKTISRPTYEGLKYVELSQMGSSIIKDGMDLAIAECKSYDNLSLLIPELEKIRNVAYRQCMTSVGLYDYENYIVDETTAISGLLDTYQNLLNQLQRMANE